MDGISGSSTEGVLWGGIGAFRCLNHTYENPIATYGMAQPRVNVKRFYLDASKHNPIYNNENLVNPSSLNCIYYIKY